MRDEESSCGVIRGAQYCSQISSEGETVGLSDCVCITEKAMPKRLGEDPPGHHTSPIRTAPSGVSAPAKQCGKKTKANAQV